jgi:GntR family transcriptional regulator
MTLETPESLYGQLAGILRDAIAAGQYPRGSMLPSEPDLASQHGVHRTTINQAVTILRQEGLVRRVRGRGILVWPVPPIHSDRTSRYDKAYRERDGGRGAFDSEIRALGMEPSNSVTVETVIPPDDVAAVLGLPAGEANTVRRMRLMSADGWPVQVAPSYIPADIAGGTDLAELDSGPGGIVSRFAELGFEQVRITESLRQRPPTAEERAFLQLDPAQTLLTELRHTGWTATGRAVEVAVHAWPIGQWEPEYGWPIS